MKVLLIDAPDNFLDPNGATRQVAPLGLCYVAAAAAKYHDVTLLLPDTRGYTGSNPWLEIRQCVETELPELVGITSVSATFPSAIRLAREVKSCNPEIRVVLGGIHASHDPLDAMNRAPHADFLIRGEGEEALVELIEALESGRTDMHSVKGLYWRDGDLVCQAAPRDPIKALDRLAFPMRDHLAWPQHILPSFYQSIITVRGCPYSCIYCAVPSSNTRLTRYRSAENVVDEIAWLRAQHQIPNLFFHDSVFSMNRKRTIKLCQLMVDRGLAMPFQCQTRTDRVDDELLDAMKQAGCQQIFFGIESGATESLKRIGKPADLEAIKGAVELVKSKGIRCTGFFIIGFPWETETHIRSTLDFGTSLDLDAISLFSATPLPGTALYEMSRRDLPDFHDFRRPGLNLTQLPDDRYAELYNQANRKIQGFNQRQTMKAFHKRSFFSPIPVPQVGSK